jgi:hypothetical protein
VGINWRGLLAQLAIRRAADIEANRAKKIFFTAHLSIKWIPSNPIVKYTKRSGAKYFLPLDRYCLLHVQRISIFDWIRLPVSFDNQHTLNHTDISVVNTGITRQLS